MPSAPDTCDVNSAAVYDPVCDVRYATAVPAWGALVFARRYGALPAMPDAVLSRAGSRTSQGTSPDAAHPPPHISVAACIERSQGMCLVSGTAGLPTGGKSTIFETAKSVNKSGPNTPFNRTHETGPAKGTVAEAQGSPRVECCWPSHRATSTTCPSLTTSRTKVPMPAPYMW